jgi:hypothetical protein
MRKREIESTGRMSDALVYGLTEEEEMIVEGE